MAKCKVCGFRLADGLAKCPICEAMSGSKQTKGIVHDIERPRYFCPSCNAEIIFEYRYCPACGKDLSKAKKSLMCMIMVAIIAYTAKFLFLQLKNFAMNARQSKKHQMFQMDLKKHHLKRLSTKYLMVDIF